MVKKTFQIKEETAKWIGKGAKERNIWLGEFLDLVATWPSPGAEAQAPATEKLTVIAEELELSNGLLKITRDDDGLPVGFVRAKRFAPGGKEEGWVPINWKQLEALNAEVQGLKRDKLAEEVKMLKTRRTTLVHRMTVGARTELAMEDDTAKPDKFWCVKCRVTAETPDEIAAHRRQCGEQYLQAYYG
jgi:hypothetical protein